MSANVFAFKVIIHVEESIEDISEYEVPPLIVYWATFEIGLSNDAVNVILSPGPIKLLGFVNELVSVTIGEHGSDHRGRNSGSKSIGAERLKFALFGSCSTHQQDISESNTEASLNILFIFEIEVTFHPPIGWLKLEARKKALIATVTLLTSHPLMFPLNADAEAKAPWIVRTFEVFQFIIVDETPEESPLLKIVAFENISWRLVRLEVFQLEIFWLKLMQSTLLISLYCLK